MSLSKVAEQYTEFMRVLTTNLQNLIKEETQPLFEKYPELRMGYHSYIPSFNDGDACEYTYSGLWSYLPSTNWDDLDYSDIELFAYEDYNAEDFKPTPKEVVDFCNTFDCLPENVLRSVFGTDVMVVIDKDGIKVEEYDCGY